MTNGDRALDLSRRTMYVMRRNKVGYPEEINSPFVFKKHVFYFLNLFFFSIPHSYCIYSLCLNPFFVILGSSEVGPPGLPRGTTSDFT